MQVWSTIIITRVPSDWFEDIIGVDEKLMCPLQRKRFNWNFSSECVKGRFLLKVFLVVISRTITIYESLQGYNYFVVSNWK